MTVSRSASWCPSFILSLWNCLLISGLCLTLVILTRLDPDLWIDFPAWPRTCLFTTDLPDAPWGGAVLGCPQCCLPPRGSRTAPCYTRTLPLTFRYFLLLRWRSSDCSTWLTSMTIVHWPCSHCNACLLSLHPGRFSFFLAWLTVREIGQAM